MLNPVLLDLAEDGLLPAMELLLDLALARLILEGRLTPLFLLYLKQLNRPKLNLNGLRRTPWRSTVTPPPPCFPPQFCNHQNLERQLIQGCNVPLCRGKAFLGIITATCDLCNLHASTVGLDVLRQANSRY